LVVAGVDVVAAVVVVAAAAVVGVESHCLAAFVLVFVQDVFVSVTTIEDPFVIVGVVGAVAPD
jgi:hypothetical protein